MLGLLLITSLVVLSAHGQSACQECDAFREEFEFLKESMQKMQGQIAVLENENQELRRSNLAAPICFSAVMTVTQVVEAGDNIVFNEELVDTRNAYNPTTGIYVVPVSGLYEVIFTLYKFGSTTYNAAYGVLYVDDIFLTEVYLYYNTDTSATAHSTASIIREFQAGDELHIVSRTAAHFYGTQGKRASQFSAKYLGPAS